jgi:hypothetical protein
MSFDHLTRRVHLYLGLALLPWFLMYGISSIPFAHTAFFDARDRATGLPAWTVRDERRIEIAAPVDDQPATLRAFGARLLDAAGVPRAGSAFGAYRQGPTQINVYAYTFWKSTQLKYFADQQLVRVEDRRFRWDHFLTGMHARGGFEQEGLLQRSWSVVVDVVCLAMVVWIASGIYMWWGVRRHRVWGALALLGGVASFLVFAAGL